MSSVVLSLLVAFVAVLTSSFQTLAGMWPDSPSNIAISEPVFYETNARFIVTNTGDLAGSLEDGFISAPILKTTIKLDPVSPNEGLVQPGISQIMFSTSLQMKAVDAYEAAKSISTEDVNLPAGNIELAVRNSAGKLEEINVSISRYELFKLLITHSERCFLDEMEQSLLNGCSGTDELHKDLEEKLRKATKAD